MTVATGQGIPVQDTPVDETRDDKKNKADVIVPAEVDFNFALSPWIPVTYLDSTHGQVGLHELFRNAHLINGIKLPNPVELFSVYRILMTIAPVLVYRQSLNSDRPGVSDGRGISRNGFCPNAVDEFFNELAGKFNLTGDNPFMQVNKIDAKANPKFLTLHASAPTASGQFWRTGKYSLTSSDPADLAKSLVTAWFYSPPGNAQQTIDGEAIKSAGSIGFSKTLAGAGRNINQFWRTGSNLAQSVLLNTPDRWVGPGLPAYLDRDAEISGQELSTDPRSVWAAGFSGVSVQFLASKDDPSSVTHVCVGGSVHPHVSFLRDVAQAASKSADLKTKSLGSSFLELARISDPLHLTRQCLNKHKKLVRVFMGGLGLPGHSTHHMREWLKISKGEPEETTRFVASSTSADLQVLLLIGGGTSNGPVYTYASLVAGISAGIENPDTMTEPHRDALVELVCHIIGETEKSSSIVLSVERAAEIIYPPKPPSPGRLAVKSPESTSLKERVMAGFYSSGEQLLDKALADSERGLKVDRELVKQWRLMTARIFDENTAGLNRGRLSTKKYRALNHLLGEAHAAGFAPVSN
ncbi:type I-E CRISPR-associated protein Cse1/CasA [Nakamurella antarctica]|uniref:Type I-E CRISPR-associated protein Cse1/CasA n=1 Tax=Nakamurella antarctica TaxID=1902245 RepID=A0A3G8ZJT8_9ACTN|nr:type I-E CRISPR-associated protein Cse1/CasA [Nakamurella antarctica]AZI57533.1 type I-E CRISPR-associated protein Cse1/CasA [Nakamurella antarctica]